jgi:hypothetical protein
LMKISLKKKTLPVHLVTFLNVLYNGSHTFHSIPKLSTILLELLHEICVVLLVFSEVVGEL